MTEAILPMDEQFWTRVTREPDDGCWVWTGGTSRDHGYPAFRVGVDGRILSARRYAYEQVIGEIPPRTVIQNRCRNRLCVNPFHAKFISRRTDRSDRTHCPQGHEYTAANIYLQLDGSRKCRRCHRDRELLQQRTAHARQRRKEREQQPEIHENIRVYQREWRLIDPDRNRRYSYKIKRKRRAWIDELKSIKGCHVCGEKHPGCLDFHHLGDKKFAVSAAFTAGLSREKLLAEFERCEVTCSNCHRKHHWDERRKVHDARDVTPTE